MAVQGVLGADGQTLREQPGGSAGAGPHSLAMCCPLQPSVESQQAGPSPFTGEETGCRAARPALR